MKLSVITVVKNSEKTIEKTIQSVLSQSNIDLEYIIVDGASKDGTLAIIEKYRTRITKLISETDAGISDAFNKGIRAATGEVISLISSDDYLLPDSLSNVNEIFSNNSIIDVVYGDVIFNEPGNEKQFVVHPDSDFSNVWHRQPLKHTSVFVKADAYHKFGLFDLNYKYAMDYELVLRFFLKGARFYYFSKPLAVFTGGGVSAKIPNDTFREVRDITIRYGYNPIKANLVYYFKCGRNFLKKIVTRIFGHQIANIYRSLSNRFDN